MIRLDRGVRAVLLSALAVVVTVSPARASEDPTLRQRVEERLQKAGVSRQGDVRVDVAGDRVVLTGAVTTVDARRSAEKAALKESKAVENRVKVIPEARPDAEIRKAVEDAVLRYPRYSIFDAVGVEVQDGVVVLRGSVHQPYRKDDIERRVGKVAGAREVRNEITVQPVSIFDDDLRTLLVRRIYGDDRFAQYAHWANPPIHIVVERGRVTLMGYVASPVEQALVGHIARQTMAFGVDNQVKLESEQRQEPKPKASPET